MIYAQRKGEIHIFAFGCRSMDRIESTRKSMVGNDFYTKKNEGLQSTLDSTSTVRSELTKKSTVQKKRGRRKVECRR